MTRRAAKTDANQGEIVAALRQVGATAVWACPVCGSEHRATAHQRRKTYCSMGCMAKAYSIRMKGENNPNYSGKSKRVCRQCSKIYDSYNKRREYCSRACVAAARTKLESISCTACGVSFNPRNYMQKYCSRDCMRKFRASNKRGYQPRPRDRLVIVCGACGKEFSASPSSGRKFCSYDCFLESGGARRAGEAAVMARKRYGAKRDANHKEIFAVIGAICPVRDLSDAGCGIPDGIAWIRDGWHWFDVKNPNTGYGRRGLNSRQKDWAGDWRGGPVFLIYTEEEAEKFARGEWCGLKRFPSMGEIVFGNKTLKVKK